MSHTKCLKLNRKAANSYQCTSSSSSRTEGRVKDTWRLVEILVVTRGNTVSQTWWRSSFVLVSCMELNNVSVRFLCLLLQLISKGSVGSSLTVSTFLRPYMWCSAAVLEEKFLLKVTCVKWEEEEVQTHQSEQAQPNAGCRLFVYWCFD